MPNWPGGPFKVDEWGNLGDFRVGSLLNTKLQGVLNLMLTENPHLSGFFLDGLGTTAYPGDGGFSWDTFPMKAEYRAGAIAQAQIAREISATPATLWLSLTASGKAAGRWRAILTPR